MGFELKWIKLKKEQRTINYSDGLVQLHFLKYNLL